MDNYTSIRLKKATAKRMEDIGVFSQSWDDLLNEMIDFIEDHNEEWEEYGDEDEGEI